MANSSLHEAIARYERALEALKSPSNLSTQQVLEIMLARDELAKVAISRTRNSVNSLIRIIDLDKSLKRRSNKVAKAIDLASYQNLLKPEETHWWWYISHSWNRLNWLWNAGIILSLSITVSLLSNIASRLFTGGVDLGGALAVGIPAALSILTAILTTETILSESIKVRSKRSSRKAANFLIAFLIMIVVILGYLLLPSWSTHYTKQGMQEHGIKKKKRWSYDFADNEVAKKSTAQTSYRRALAVNPNDAEAHFLLGVFYEDLNDIENALKEYRYAVQGAFPPAYNNLARLYIKRKEYSIAASLLYRLVKLDIEEVPELKYTRYKNLGWLELEQGHLESANEFLDRAIEVATQDIRKPDKYGGAVYCLKARLIAQQKKLDSYGNANNSGTSRSRTSTSNGSNSKEFVISLEELSQWEKCLSETGSTPEGALWLSIAKQKMKKSETSNKGSNK